jgi:acyl carrier protein
MTQQEIIDRLREAMQSSSIEEVDWQAVTAETTIGELGFDSLSILDLIYDVQQEFGIEFDAEELVNVNTVGDLADFIAEETKA